MKLDAMMERLLDRGYQGYRIVELAKKHRCSVTLEQLAAGHALASRYVR